MTTIRCCVIDDEPLAAELIAEYIRRTPFLKLIDVFSSAQEAIKTIINGDVDLIFLDIQMPQLGGMEFAKIVPPTCRIIFTTAYDSYAVQGFKVNAIDYLLKPVNYEEFLTAATKALKTITNSGSTVKSEPEHIIVKSEYKLVQIPIDDILYIEGLKDYVKIYLHNENKSIMTLMSIRSLDQTLPRPKFMRVHRSYIVNMSRIKIIERNRIVFGNKYIPISESYKQAFADYIAERSSAIEIRSNQEE